MNSIAATLVRSSLLFAASVALQAEDTVPFAQLTLPAPHRDAGPLSNVPAPEWPGDAGEPLGSLSIANPETQRHDDRSDFLFPRKGGSKLTLMTGIPYVGIAEYAYGFTDRFSVGIFAGIITPEIQGYGLRFRYIITQPSRDFRVHVKAPVIYYPASPGLEPWFLTWPTLSAEWRRENGIRLWTGVGLVATNGGVSAGGGGYGTVTTASASSSTEPSSYGSSSYGTEDTYGAGSYATNTSAALTKIAGTSEGGVWNTFQIGFSKPVTRRIIFQFEAAAVMKGAKLSPAKSWVAGPPVIITTGLTYSF